MNYDYKLPKRALSWSAIDLWRRNPRDFRLKYYENKPLKFFAEQEMLFGKQIGELLEANDPTLSKIPRYDTPEQKCEVEIEPGLLFVGYLDSFDSKKNKILEYKTSHNPDRWNLPTVHKHDQLVIYSVLVQLKFGKVDNTLHLIWMETAWRQVVDVEHGQVNQLELYLTGKMKRFRRVISQKERNKMRQTIIETAREISDDYKVYLKALGI